MMDQPVLRAELRSTAGEKPRSLRREGYVPAILYGRKADSVPIKLPARQLEQILATGGGRRIIRLQMEEGTDREVPVMLKELQRDPINGRLLHVDFLRISLAEKVTARVPVVFRGEETVEKAGGILQHQVREVEVECLPADLPDHISIDVSGLSVGDHLTAGEMSMPPGVRLVSAPDEVVVTVTAPRMAEEAAEKAEEEAGEEEEAKPEAGEE